MEHFFRKTSAGRIHGVEVGNPQAPGLVLLHSNGGAWRQYSPMLKRLSEHYRCVAIDLPGQGDSFSLPDHWDVEQYGDVVAELVGQLELKKTTVLGCSIGGSVAMDLAARHGKLFERLILVETPVRTNQQWAARWTPMESLFGVVLQSYEFAAKRVIGLTPEGYNEWNIDRHKAGAKAMVSVMWAMRQHDAHQAIAQIKMPTLVVFGESTPVADSMDFYRQQLPNAPLVVLPGCGHFPSVENPEALVDAVLGWKEAAHV